MHACMLLEEKIVQKVKSTSVSGKLKARYAIPDNARDFLAMIYNICQNFAKTRVA